MHVSDIPTRYNADGEPRFVRVFVAFVDEGGDHDNAFETFIKTSSEFVEEEDEWVFFYGLPLQEIVDGYENETVFEGEWVITGIEYVTDAIL